MTIVPKAESLGHVRFFKRTAKDGWVYIHVLFCTLAGSLAEKKFTGRSSHVGARSDYYKALDYARMVDDTGAGYHENDPLPQALVSGAMKQTERLVARWRPSIQAVALALLEKETLKESEIISILESDAVMKEQRLLWKELRKHEDEERERRMDALEARLGIGSRKEDAAPGE